MKPIWRCAPVSCTVLPCILYPVSCILYPVSCIPVFLYPVCFTSFPLYLLCAVSVVSVVSVLPSVFRRQLSGVHQHYVLSLLVAPLALPLFICCSPLAQITCESSSRRGHCRTYGRAGLEEGQDPATGSSYAAPSASTHSHEWGRRHFAKHFCSTCKIQRPDRSKHCQTCNRFVSRAFSACHMHARPRTYSLTWRASDVVLVCSIFVISCCERFDHHCPW
jgi:hypothetical protein